MAGQPNAFTDLVGQLSRVPPRDRAAAEMARVLHSLAVATHPHLDVPQPMAQRYTRTCLHASDRFEIVLIDWSPGAKAPIHDHGGQHCWFVLLEGSLRVEDFRRLDSGAVAGRASLDATGGRTLYAGDVDVRIEQIELYDLHRVEVAGAQRAQTLHVYAAPIREYFSYDAAAGTCTPVRSSYDAIRPIGASA